MAAPASARISGWPNLTPAFARSVSRTGRTKCIAAPSPRTNWPNTLATSAADRMWKEGLSFALLAWSLNALALAFGAYLGLRGLFDPNWAAKLVRLKPDERGGGFAEFRATYGG